MEMENSIIINWNEELKKLIRQIGVKQGDTLYVMNDIVHLMIDAKHKMNIRTAEDRDTFLNRIVDTLQEAVGEEGTLLFPVFNWDFCKGVPFDIRNTKGKTGVFGDWIRQNRKDFSRTKHPMFSFMVWGKNSEIITSLSNIDSWGEDSPFEWFYQNYVKGLAFGVDMGKGYTFEHYIEEKIHVPYRYMKDFRADYIDANGEKTNRVYKMFVRDLDVDLVELDTPDEFFIKNCNMKVAELDSLKLSLVTLKDTFEPLRQDFLYNNAANTYKFINYKIDWNVYQTHEDDLGH